MAEFKHVSFKSPNVWELGGESVVHTEVDPDPPEHGRPVIVRLTHSNVYGPVDDVRFEVRIGSTENPTEHLDLDGATDWQPMELVEEIVWLDGQERHRSEVADQLDPRQETVWAGTFERALELSAGDQRLELKVVSSGYLQSWVISDWEVRVQG